MTYMPNHVCSFAKPLLKVCGIWSNLWNLVLKNRNLATLRDTKRLYATNRYQPNASLPQRHCDVQGRTQGGRGGLGLKPPP